MTAIRPCRRWAVNQTLYRAALIAAAKGGVLAGITVGDVLELFAAEDDGPRANPCGGRALFYRSVRRLGVLGDGVPARLRELRTSGQRTPEELIDRYRLSCRPVRDLLVDYLRERQPALDYTSVEALSYHLGMRFWLTQADVMPHQLERLETRRSYAAMLTERSGPGDRDRARVLLAESVSAYRRLGMLHRAELARKVLKQV